MIFFGHLGLTVGAARAAELAALKGHRVKPGDVDYRPVLLGSILPDLIDKPVGALVFVSTYHNGRIYAHTLLFSLLLLLVGVVVLRKKRSSGGLLLWGASAVHLVLDSMWRYPETLFWPFWNIGSAQGAGAHWASVLFGFPERFDNWLSFDLMNILKNPSPLLFEAAGLIILLIFFVKLRRSRGLLGFLKSGRLTE